MPSIGSAMIRSIAAADPEATICPAPLRFAAARPWLSSHAATSSGSPSITAAIDVGSSAHALAISAPRTAASATASAGLSTCGDRGRGQFADGVAA